MRPVTVPGGQPALDRYRRKEQEQRHAAESGGLAQQGRVLPREVDDLRREHVEAERHAEQ
jgi:hypothetical protein